MPFTEARFLEFESLQQVALQWNLNFRLLSKNDLITRIALYTSEKFQLGRVSLNGKIDQHGLCPPGFRSIVVPVPGGSHFNWFNRLTNDHEMLIYPKDGTIDAVSYNHFDVYVFSIVEYYLLDCIEKLQYSECLKRFVDGEFRLKSSEKFCRQFHNASQHFFSMIKGASPGFGSENYDRMLDDVLNDVLKQIDDSHNMIPGVFQRNRDVGLQKAVDIINHHLEEDYTISQLCNASGMSERTLQYAFRERYHVTPKDYVKAVKLHKVREELTLNKSQMISTIAAKYGFWHMGQFAADYKKWFGELPTQTKRKY
ncbi:MAG: helix-turn-helix domain-containing protein [Cytophagales bacterium]|nr:helix-turn-helix domain-containing protein [Cytophagales bacterium]